MNNGIIGNLGASKRSVYGVMTMAAILKLSGSEGKYVAGAMVLIFSLAVALCEIARQWIY